MMNIYAENQVREGKLKSDDNDDDNDDEDTDNYMYGI